MKLFFYNSERFTGYNRIQEFLEKLGKSHKDLGVSGYVGSDGNNKYWFANNSVKDMQKKIFEEFWQQYFSLLAPKSKITELVITHISHPRAFLIGRKHKVVVSLEQKINFSGLPIKTIEFQYTTLL